MRHSLVKKQQEIYCILKCIYFRGNRTQKTLILIISITLNNSGDNQSSDNQSNPNLHSDNTTRDA